MDEMVTNGSGKRDWIFESTHSIVEAFSFGIVPVVVTVYYLSLVTSYQEQSCSPAQTQCNITSA